MLAHDGPDGIGRFVGVVKRDAANIVVQDVRLNDAVEEVAADEAHLAVDGGSSAANIVPLVGRVMREGWVGVLKECDGDCDIISKCRYGKTKNTHRASG